MKYQADGIPLVVLAGKDYGMGSSRDWAAKGTYLLGVKAVIAESFERIHRSNLVGMGMLPLHIQEGPDPLQPRPHRHRHLRHPVLDDNSSRCRTSKSASPAKEGDPIEFTATCRIDTPVEIEYYPQRRHSPPVLREMRKRIVAKVYENIVLADSVGLEVRPAIA